jgi:hypothetical protein
MPLNSGGRRSSRLLSDKEIIENLQRDNARLKNKVNDLIKFSISLTMRRGSVSSDSTEEELKRRGLTPE